MHLYRNTSFESSKWLAEVISDVMLFVDREYVNWGNFALFEYTNVAECIPMYDLYGSQGYDIGKDFLSDIIYLFNAIISAGTSGV